MSEPRWSWFTVDILCKWETSACVVGTMILEPFVTMELCSPGRVYSDNIAGALGRSIRLVFKELAVQLLVVGKESSIYMKRSLNLRIFPDLHLTPRLNSLICFKSWVCGPATYCHNLSPEFDKHVLYVLLWSKCLQMFKRMVFYSIAIRNFLHKSLNQHLLGNLRICLV